MPQTGSNSQTPYAASTGIVIELEDDGSYAPGRPVWIMGKLTVGTGDIDKCTPEQWLRSIFVSAVGESNQLPYIANLIGERILFREDINTEVAAGGHIRLSEFRFNLAEILNLPLSGDGYYVQVSARHYRSNVLLLRAAS